MAATALRVLVVGSGGREHALAWRLRQSPLVSALFAAPGNSGTAAVAHNLPIADTDLDAIVAGAGDNAIDLVVVGPETPLALGLADRLAEAGIPAFGPSQAAAQLEASKSFARSVMDAAGVPGPGYRVFDAAGAALDYVQRRDAPVVVKANGLAAGKGVAMCATRAEAKQAILACMDERVFGAAGDTVVIEDWLEGPEISVFGFVDGKELSPVAAATDYKRIGEGGVGPNTGGMGSYGPPRGWDADLAERVRHEFMLPVIAELARRGVPYRGALYCGLMLTASGPRVLEFNCRFGDPETQVIMPRLVSDPAEVMLACAVGSLGDIAPVRWSDRFAVGVVMVSQGYPGAYATGFPISGLDFTDQGSADPESNDPEIADNEPDTIVFHAGAQNAPAPDAHVPDSGKGREIVVTAGGRVLTCVGLGNSVAQARARAYRRAEGISFHGSQYRRDIAAEAVVEPAPAG